MSVLDTDIATHERTVNRLRLRLRYKDNKLDGMSLSRSGDQRDEGAGFIDIDADETTGLRDFLLCWYKP